MSYENIISTVTDHIAVITLNRPKRLNAVTPLMAQEIRTALYAAADNDDVRVIVITGAGRGFCAGADMAEIQAGSETGLARLKDAKNARQGVTLLTAIPTEEELDPENSRNLHPQFRGRYSFLHGIQKPIIGAVNGPANGIGLLYALHCDLRFASESASFGTSFGRRGLIAEHGSSWLLPRIVGLPRALELLFSPRLITAQEALAMGLVNRLYPDAGFMEAVLAYAAELATLVSPRSLRVMKQQVYNALFQDLAQTTDAADAALVECVASADFAEGVAHFLEKRPPVFTGR